MDSVREFLESMTPLKIEIKARMKNIPETTWERRDDPEGDFHDKGCTSGLEKQQLRVEQVAGTLQEGWLPSRKS